MARKIIHVIPYDGIGGVEKAAATAQGATSGDLRLERMFIFSSVRNRTERKITFHPLLLWKAAGRLARAGPDLVILSLWRSVIVGALAKLRGCRAPMVLFLHNARDAHRVDRWITRIAASRVAAIWADSRATLETRLPAPLRVPGRVISYLTEHRAPVRGPLPNPEPHFVFWGRLAAQKDPLRTISLFARIHALRPDARLVMLGPDGGLGPEVKAAIAANGLHGKVELPGPADRDLINTHARRASFYIQTSIYEGMALSVLEAMQMGLVPVVTPVGEIARYTGHLRNAVWIGDGPTADDAAVGAILELLERPAAWRDLRIAAMNQFSHTALYADDILAAANELLAMGVEKP